MKTLVELFSKPGTWQQRGLVTKKRRRCLVIGMGFVYKLQSQQTLVLDKIRAVIKKKDVVAWNDAPGRTQAEVLELCRKAGV